MKNKKIIIAVIAVAAVIAAVITAIAVWGNKNSDKQELQSIALSEKVNSYIMPVNLIAHRGFSGLAPENTVASIKAAGDADFFGAEFDIRLSADNVWVVSHDNDVERMTDGEGLISEKTLEEIKKLNIDSGSNVIQHNGEKIPTLEEALTACKEYGAYPIIEIKLEDGQKPDYDALARILREKGFADCTVIAFSSEALTGLKEKLPTAEYWLLVSEMSDSVIKTCVDNGFDGIDFNATKKKNLKYIEKAAEADLVVGAWTVNDIGLLDDLYEKGVYYITTNVIYPS